MIGYAQWAANRGVFLLENVKPYDFHSENVLECIRIGDSAVMTEAVDFQEFLVSSDEIIAEAVIGENPKLNVINEAVFASIKERAIKFFEKAKAIAMGIVNRIKEFMLKFTGKTSQWADTIAPRIDAADTAGGFSAETYNWNTSYVATGISAGISQMHSAWRDKVQSKVRDAKAIMELKKYAGKMAGGTRPATQVGMSQNDDGTYSAQKISVQEKGSSVLARETETIQRELQDLVEKAPSIAGQAFKVRGNNPDEIWNAVVIMAHGGDQQKAQRQIGASAKSMLEAVRQSGTWLGSIQKTYEDHVTVLEQYRRSLEAEGAQLDSASASAAGDAIRTAETYVRAKYEYCIRATQIYESYMAKGNSLNIQLIQDMTRDYMQILTAYANKRGK